MGWIDNLWLYPLIYDKGHSEIDIKWEVFIDIKWEVFIDPTSK